MSPKKDEAVRLSQDAETGDRFLIYGTDRGIKVELRYTGETLWATQDQMAEIFGVDRTSITKRGPRQLRARVLRGHAEATYLQSKRRHFGGLSSFLPARDNVPHLGDRNACSVCHERLCRRRRTSEEPG
jgi:hypothetical protein